MVVPAVFHQMIALKGGLSGLSVRQFLATESPVKTKKNAFYLI